MHPVRCPKIRVIVLRYRSATIIEHSMCAVCDDDRVSNGATDADTDGEGL